MCKNPKYRKNQLQGDLCDRKKGEAGMWMKTQILQSWGRVRGLDYQGISRDLEIVALFAYY